MDKIILTTIFLSVAFFAPFAIAQEKEATPIDDHLDESKTILIVKCLSVGPVNILLRANGDVEILHVVKGKETLRKISVNSGVGMVEGRRYLIRTIEEANSAGNYFRIDSYDSAVPIWAGEDINTLKALSPKIVVLRTMNLRVDDIENQIRRLNYELDALKQARREN